MRLNLLISCFVTFCGFSGFAQQKEANYQVIPLPQQIDLQHGRPFILNAQSKIKYATNSEMLKSDAVFLSNYIKETTGRSVPISPITIKTAKEKNVILLKIDKSFAHNEGYELKVEEQQITITGKDENGVFYGIQTLRKSMPAIAKGNNIAFPCVTINDYPRFAYRGMMLDCGRHFFPAKFIKEYIDLLALHNMNYFHWHLTEDQGWRIEIKKYPKLTEIGSKRAQTVIGHNSGKYDGQPYGGFYTQAEIKEIVAYAKARHITIIPEIDMPGHMSAALAAYPYLGCTGGPYKVQEEWGVFDDILCIGKESTFTFIEDVLSEVISLFPSKYIHIGGDETPRVRWKACPLCQKRIQDEGLKSDSKHSAEDRLQSYFMSRIEKFLNSKGRQIIGWDEILEGDVAPNATVMSWRGMSGGIEAAHLHHNVVMTPNTYVYFDYYQSTDIANEPLAIGGYLPVKDVYNFEPAPDSLAADVKPYIIGAQANVWSEYIPTTKQVEYMVLPRMSALAEVQWSNQEKKDYKDFASRLPRLLDIFQRDGLNYAKHVYDITDECQTDTTKKCIFEKMSTIDNAPIYYTTDGTEPTASSTRYTEPIKINKSCALKAVAIRPNHRSNVLSKEFFFNKATLCPIKLKDDPKGRYAFNGAPALNDGLKGNSNYASGLWLGFYNQIVEATIDMGTTQEINQVSSEAIVNLPAFIMGASYVSVAVSEDGVNFTEVGNMEYPEDTDLNKIDIAHYDVAFAPTDARYVKVTIKPSSALPKGHYSEGKPAFLFIDEITIE
ncbi:MAG: family 20 glycosylhydrolase [Bacteroidales bacterium]|nr:family 20 glycosylhydrolase [Bacteroidales bacterium]